MFTAAYIRRRASAASSRARRAGAYAIDIECVLRSDINASVGHQRNGEFDPNAGGIPLARRIAGVEDLANVNRPQRVEHGFAAGLPAIGAQ